MNCMQALQMSSRTLVPSTCSMVSCPLTTSRCRWHLGTRIRYRDLSSRMMMSVGEYPFLIWSGVSLTISLMSLTSCFSGQVSRGSGEIAVEITCIGCTSVRLHVESSDSCNGGATTILKGSSRLEIAPSHWRHHLVSLASERESHGVTASCEKRRLSW